jgi:hypothetical protein
MQTADVTVTLGFVGSSGSSLEISKIQPLGGNFQSFTSSTAHSIGSYPHNRDTQIGAYASVLSACQLIFVLETNVLWFASVSLACY